MTKWDLSQEHKFGSTYENQSIYTNELIYKTETDLQTQRTNLWLPGGKGGGGIVREFGIDMYTLLYLKWITNKDLLYSIGNSAQYYVTT